MEKIDGGMEASSVPSQQLQASEENLKEERGEEVPCGSRKARFHSAALQGGTSPLTPPSV